MLLCPWLPIPKQPKITPFQRGTKRVARSQSLNTYLTSYVKMAFFHLSKLWPNVTLQPLELYTQYPIIRNGLNFRLVVSYFFSRFYTVFVSYFSQVIQSPFLKFWGILHSRFLFFFRRFLKAFKNKQFWSYLIFYSLIFKVKHQTLNEKAKI